MRHLINALTGGNMRKLIMAIIAAAFAAVTVSAFAADAVKTDPNPGAKPGRQIDDGSAVKSGGKVDKPGRAADEPAPTTDSGKKKKSKKKKSTPPQQ
jgi:Ni/Co efflux regulator RcnB